MQEKATLSLHMDARHNDKHDLRQIYVPYVDKSRSKNNYYYEKNISREEAFEYLFADAVNEYNQRQSRPERRIENYLDKLLQAEERQKQTIREKRLQGASFKELAKFKKAVHPSVQMIIAIGNMQDNPEFMSNGGKMSDVVKSIQMEYIRGFQKRNPNAFLYQAASHGDEQGVWHSHLSIVFFADGFSKGMKRQVSQKKALEAMGFYSDTEKGADGKLHLAIEKWQNREREVLKEICKKQGINVVIGKNSNENLNRERYILKKQKEASDKILQDANEKAELVLQAQEKADKQLSDIKDFIENTENGAVYSIYAENRSNQEKITQYENQNKHTYQLLARIWEQYKKENAEYWENYRIRKEELYYSLRAVRNGVWDSKKRMEDCLYSIIDSGTSLLGKLISLVELLGIFIENRLLKSELSKTEQSYKELKDNARTVLQASKETSIALKSKDLERIELSIKNWNDTLQGMHNNLMLHLQSLDKQYIGR